MTATDNFILSGRYQILETLGQGSDGTVYLARHQSLELERAIKVFPKRTDAPSLFTISEAHVLKSIQHPGIPTIYDLEEDESNYYLVEEYIHGESLEQFLLHQQPISLNLFLKFCSQLCDIFRYLHSLCPTPILYQDLKPEHIIVCGLQIKLIDFSVSSFFSDSGNGFNYFGNAAFSAPELLDCRPVTLSSDIYSIGKIMAFMSDYTDVALPRNILTIIQKATNADPALRYETVEKLASAINQANDNTGGMHLARTIAVIGSFPGCGATHIAISLVTALNAIGRTAIYYEKNSTDSLRKAVPYMPNVWEQDGCYIQGCFKGYPLYGESIRIPKADCDIAVIDYGCRIPSDLAAAEQILLVCGGASWRLSDAPDFCHLSQSQKGRLRIIANLCERKSAIYFARKFDAPVYLYPFDADPFHAGKSNRQFVDWLSLEEGRIRLFFYIKSLIFRLLR